MHGAVNTEVAALSNTFLLGLFVVCLVALQMLNPLTNAGDPMALSISV